MSAWKTAAYAIRSCLENGVREFVVCAGARNAALVGALAQAEAAGAVRLWSHFEERSAAFFALGRTRVGHACAVLTTSGSAVAELLPATIEARYQGRPLVLLTADRPARFRGTGAPQAIVQPGIFGDHAGSGNWANWDRRSPWHLNVELEEELGAAEESSFSNLNRPLAAEWPRPAVGSLARWLREDIHGGLVAMVAGLEPDEQEDTLHFLRTLGVPTVAEATSGLRERLGNQLLAEPDSTLLGCQPTKILRIGDVPSGRFWRDLEKLEEIEVWNLTRSGWPGLARPSHTITGEIGRILRALGDPEEIGDPLGLLRGNDKRWAKLEELLEAYPDSEPSLLRTFSRYAAFGEGLFLGNSMPVREWNRFAQREQALKHVTASRGVNGIDGQISTWLGWSAEKHNSWCLVGDLTALYDLAAPALLMQVERRGRVLGVINNGGGRIFSRVPRLRAMEPRARELMLNPHAISLDGWAKMWGMRHLAIASQDDFDTLEPGAEPVLVELVPSPSETEQFWKSLEPDHSFGESIGSAYMSALDA